MKIGIREQNNMLAGGEGAGVKEQIHGIGEANKYTVFFFKAKHIAQNELIMNYKTVKSVLLRELKKIIRCSLLSLSKLK